MRKMIKNKILVWGVLVAIIMAVFGVSYFFKTRPHSPSSAVAQSSDSNNTSIEITNSPAAENTPTTAPNSIDTSSINTSIPVLMYHHVKVNTDPSNEIEVGLDLPPNQFELEMKSVSEQNLSTIQVKNLFGSDQNKKIALTFDDGYKDIITNAYPIMQKYHFIGTAFIITGFVGNDGYMTWDDIKTLQNAGWEIGSHTVDHPDLTTVSLKKAQIELDQSKKDLESNLGNTIVSFGYPAGKYNADVIKLVNNAGYQYAATTHSGHNNSSDKKLELNRLRINGSETIQQFNNLVK